MSRAEELWERLVRAALRRDKTGDDAYGRPAGGIAGNVPSALAKNRDIDEILRLADEIQDDDPNVSRILCEHAYSLSQNLDPNSEGRGVLQFKTGLMSVIKQKLAKREVGTIDRSQDIARLQQFDKSYREKNNVDELRKEEMELRESGAFSRNLGELERKTVKRKRVFATLKVLGTVFEQLSEEIPDEICCGTLNWKFMDSSTKLDICDGIDGEANGVDGFYGEDVSWELIIGMCFSSIEELKSFYGTYASIKGFGWKIRTSKKGEDGETKYLMLSCSREGYHVSEIPCTLKTLPTRKKNCPAKITAKLTKDGLWYVSTFEPKHSHEISPTKARLFKANKKMNLHVKRTIQINDDAGVRINKTFQSLITNAGGHEQIPFCERDVRNYVNKERRAIGKEGDVKALLSYFCRMTEQNKDFFYDIDMDDDFHVRNVFWADARSRATYAYFGDVVTFDTTYLTNKYDMPFAAFVGVNHHVQSTLLGCGLVSVEDTESFVWLFQSRLHCMLGKAPMGIITDQCKAMQNAIELVFPTTRYRRCLWHIMKKIPEKLSGYGEYKRIKSAMKAAVYDTITAADFEEKWYSFIDKFELGQNDWFSRMYKEHHRWAPTMLKKYFWAGMSTTQRSESIHAFFEGYINSTTSLNQFVKQYDNALKSRAEKEFQADFQCMDTTIPCGSNSSIEKQFQCEYTHAKFKEVQAEFRSKMNCASSLKAVDGCLATYHVLEEVLVGDKPKECVFKVVFNRNNHDFSCECSLLEFRGILCCHVLCVCTQERLKNVPEKYVLARWKKNIKRKHSYIKTSYGVAELHPQMDRFDKLCKHFYEVAEVAA